MNASLQQNANGSYSPAVSSQPLVLSGGGGTTLATMTADNRTLTISWPTTVPAPTVSGATATYANVYSGVDLQVTTDGQGGFSDVLIVHSAAAAANPALSSLNLTTSTTGGLVMSIDASGDLIASAAAGDPALITFNAPQVWDSTPAPGSEATVTGSDGVTRDATNGDPVSSTVSGPGTGAQVATIPVSLSGSTLTLSPPASVLTGASTTYPVYIDPTWHSVSATPTQWTQVFSGWPTTTSYYGKQEDLRVGVCPSDLSPDCNGMGIARTYFQVNLPKEIQRVGTQIHTATVNSTEDWSASCTHEPVRLWHVNGTINSGTDWHNAPALSGTASDYNAQNVAFGHDSSCGYLKGDVTFTVTPFIQADVGHASYQTFALQAGNEDTANLSVADLYWKKFKYSDFNLAITYNNPPDQPTQLSTSPGGGCHSSSASPAVIGNDDVKFSSYAADADGDQHLSTTFTLYNASGTKVYTSPAQNTPDDTTAHATITRAGMQAFGTNGATTAYKYYYQTQVKDDNALPSPLSDKCWILYNPKGPQVPTASYSPATAALGQTVTASFSSPGCSPTTNPCPATYSYAEGAGKPVSVSANSSHNATATIQVTQTGPITMTAYSTDSSGNRGEPDTQQIDGTIPITPYNDGYFTGGTYPDLLSVGTGSKPGLWLYTGSGNGTVNTPVDIGSLGIAINPGSDGPGDWAGAMALHGDFTGRHVQDVAAYYPPGNSQGLTGGSLVVVDGDGTASPLNPGSGHLHLGSLAPTPGDPTGDPLGAAPAQLTAVGNASGLGTGAEDLIGIVKDTTTGKAELDLFTDGRYANTAAPGDYAYCNTITTTAPGGSSDSWANYQIAAAGTGAQLLFALNTGTHVLYETGGPFSLTMTGGATPTCTGTISQPAWTTVNTTLAALAGLAQVDVNHAGQVEIWDLGSGTPVSYALSGTTLNPESNNLAAQAANSWSLTDGNPGVAGAATASALDSVTGTSAPVSGNYAWTADNQLATDLNLDGTSGYVAPPPTTIPAGSTPTISLWFKTTPRCPRLRPGPGPVRRRHDHRHLQPRSLHRHQRPALRGMVDREHRADRLPRHRR